MDTIVEKMDTSDEKIDTTETNTANQKTIDVLPDDAMILILEQLDNRSMMSAIKTSEK